MFKIRAKESYSAISSLKKSPGEGTGPTIHADFRGNLVGRVPSRGEQDVFEQAVRLFLHPDAVEEGSGADRVGVRESCRARLSDDAGGELSAPEIV